jgi:hypothetical protein
MKDIYNIVKVSDIDDVNCNRIIKKCFEKPNMINYYYPHIFMNRDKIDKDQLIKDFEEQILNVERDKNVEITMKKYNTLTCILESLFLCVLDMSIIKQIQKYIQYNFSKDDNNIIDIVNHILQEKPMYNLEQLLNDKIDNTHSVYIIEKVIEHIKMCYTFDNLEKQTLQQYHILSAVNQYIFKQKYIPYVNKIINFNKKELIKNYINNCVINSSHDDYITNIIEQYQEFKSNSYDIIDDCNWESYFMKVGSSLNINNPKEKILKCIFRINILNMIIQINSNKDSNKNDIKIQNLHNNLHSIIDLNKIDKILINSYMNMVKNNCAHEKLAHIENIIKYFTNFGNLAKEFIQLIMPKYFSKDKDATKYYLEVFNRLNILCNKKLSVIDTLIEQQKKFAEDLKNTQVDNESRSIFNKDLVTLFNFDNKYIDTSNVNNNITIYSPELKAYNTFAMKWFDRNFNGLMKININEYLSNGKIQIDNTIINTNLILLNALFMFNNTTQSISINEIKTKFNESIIDDIINTFEYYNIITKTNDLLTLNTTFFATKQEVKIELIKKVIENITIEEKVESLNIKDKSTMIESYIIKSIKTTKVHKDEIFNIVSQKCGVIDSSLFDKCMKRLLVLDYYEIVNDHLIYVP